MDDFKNDIDKYLKGQLTPAQMHALEKKALGDPFLADALEGLGTVPAEDLKGDLNRLKASLNKRVEKRLNPWGIAARIAAGLLLLAVASYIIISLVDQPGQKAVENLALNKETDLTPELEKEPAPSIPDSSQGEVPLTSSVPEGPKEEQARATTPRKQESRVAEQPQAQNADEGTKASRKEPAEPQALSDSDISESIREEEMDATTTPLGAAPSVSKLDNDKAKDKEQDDTDRELSRKKAISGAAASERKEGLYKPSRRVIRGKVTFAGDGTALPGVNVLLKGSNEGTVTDEKGMYQISVVEGEPTLIFSFIGFSNKEVTVPDGEVNVELDADVSELSEVVVVGYGSDDDFLPSTPTVMELATPEGGRKVFKQYLENNLRYPEQALKNGVEGKVTVQFTIGLSGQLSDFRIIRGIGFGCDEEVIRLIKEGPKWSPTKKNEAPIRDRGRVRMRFALPKK